MTDKSSNIGNDRVKNFMASVVTGKTTEVKDKLIAKPKKVVRKPVIKKKKNLLTKTHNLPFGGVITRVTRGLKIEEVDEHRRSVCEHLKHCNSFAAEKRMAAFSCINCPFFKK